MLGRIGSSSRSLGRGELELSGLGQYAGQACQELSNLLSVIFDSVLEAFVFLDANDDGILDHGELQRQLQRIGSDLSVDQLMLEAGAQGKLPTLRMEEFAAAVSWHPLPQWSADLDREYARTRAQRSRAVGRVHEWQLRTQRSRQADTNTCRASVARSPPPEALSDVAGPWALSIPNIVVQPKSSGSVSYRADASDLASTGRSLHLDPKTGESRPLSEPQIGEAESVNQEEGRGRQEGRFQDKSKEPGGSPGSRSQERGRSRTRNPQPYYGGMHGTWADDEKKRMQDEKRRLELALIEAQKELKMVARKQRIKGLGTAGEKNDEALRNSQWQPEEKEWKDTKFGKLKVVETPAHPSE
eukprot:1228233-Rhodomonas_salina.1